MSQGKATISSPSPPSSFPLRFPSSSLPTAFSNLSLSSLYTTGVLDQIPLRIAQAPAAPRPHPEMAQPLVQDASKADHLVVMFHGLWGNPAHLQHLRDTLHEQRGGKGLYILVPKSNSNNFTYDGIEVGAERIMTEIEATLKQLEAAGSKIKKISLAGYSQGGLVARYVAGLLYSNGVFEHIQPVNFTTFATPHLGTRAPKLGYGTDTWNFLGSRTLSTSGQQMWIVDNFRGTGRPILSILADPNSIFVKGLSMFKRKSIYANTLNDRSVPFYTAAISRIDPYVDVDVIDVHPFPNQPQDVILDPTNPVSRRKHPRKDPTSLRWHERYIISERTRSSLPFYAILCTLLPIAVPVFLVNAGYQTYQSARRVRLHEGGTLMDLKRYRTPFLLDQAQALQDSTVERLASQSQEEYLPTPPPEPASPETSSTMKLARKEQAKNDTTWPTLALTEEQFEMIDNIDRYIGFTKYPVHIQNVRHTHAAIVVRMTKDSFAEGKAVSAHWAKEFET